MRSKRILKTASIALPAFGIILALTAWARPIEPRTWWCTTYLSPASPCGETVCGSVISPNHERPKGHDALARWDPQDAATCEKDLQAPMRAGFIFLGSGVLAGFASFEASRKISRRARTAPPGPPP